MNKIEDKNMIIKKDKQQISKLENNFEFDFSDCHNYYSYCCRYYN
jgi:hypothetical protein